MDLAEGHIAALDYLQKSRGLHVWNLGTGRGHSVLEVIDTFSKVADRAIAYHRAPRRQGDAATSFADPGKAMTDLGWKAQHSLTEMLQDHWNWQLNNPTGYTR